MEHSDRYARGLERLNTLNPAGGARVQESLRDIAPDFGRLMIEFGYGDLLTRPGLDMKARQIATTAALAGMGNAQPQLRFHIGASLNAGCSPDEIVEILYIVAVFAGFPAALNSLTAAKEEFSLRGVSPAAPASSGHAQKDRRQRGLDALEATSAGAGQAVLDSLADIAPDMAGFILDFSYGDVISRTELSPRHKEIAMIAIATASGVMRPQLMVHIRAALHVGVTRQEIIEVIMQMAGYSGFPSALNGLSAAREAFADAP